MSKITLNGLCVIEKNGTLATKAQEIPLITKL